MTVLHRRARTRPSGPFRSRRAPHSRPVPGLDKRPNCIREAWPERGFRTDGSEAAPPHLGARCRSQLGSYAPAAPTHSGKSTCDTCSHRRAVASLRRWQEQTVVRERHPNAPPQTEPTRLERHRHHCFSRPYAGTETATKCRDRRGTISLDWNNCVQCISKLRGACGGCTRSSLVQKKCCTLRKAQRHPKCAMHTAHRLLPSVRP